VPYPTPREHTAVFFRRTKVTSRAWKSPKIPCSRLRVRESWEGEERGERLGCFMVPPGPTPSGICHRSRTRFEVSPRWAKHRVAAELAGFTLSHLPTPICGEPIYLTQIVTATISEPETSPTRHGPAMHKLTQQFLVCPFVIGAPKQKLCLRVVQ
jgi:hypothetical protein